MALTFKDLKKIASKKGFRDDSLISDIYLNSFVYIEKDSDGNARFCTSKPVGTCNRTGKHVYPTIAEGYSAYCPELDEDLYDFEWTKFEEKKNAPLVIAKKIEWDDSTNSSVDAKYRLVSIGRILTATKAADTMIVIMKDLSKESVYISLYRTFYKTYTIATAKTIDKCKKKAFKWWSDYLNSLVDIK